MHSPLTEYVGQGKCVQLAYGNRHRPHYRQDTTFSTHIALCSSFVLCRPQGKENSPVRLLLRLFGVSNDVSR